MKNELVNVENFVREISKQTGYSQRAISEVLECAEKVMIDTVKSGKDCKIFKSLTIMPTIRPAGSGRNIATGEKLQIPEMTIPKAKFSKAFKDCLNK